VGKQPAAALATFERMRAAGLAPDVISVSTMLSALNDRAAAATPPEVRWSGAGRYPTARGR